MTTILPRRGTAALWTARNPVLAAGEVGYETDTKKTKMGDGATAWASLAYQDYASSRTLRPNGPNTVFLGDSNTYLPGTGLVPTWAYQAAVASKQRIKFSGIYATTGDTIQEASDHWLSSILALSPAPSACIIALGTNDTNRNTGTAFDLVANSASYMNIVNKLKAAGIAPIATQIIPNNNASTVIQTNIQTWNRRLRVLGDTYGFPVIDTYTPLVNTANGQIQTTLLDNSDGLGLHMSNLGRKTFAAKIAADAAPLYPPAPNLTSKFGTDPTNLVPWATAWSTFNDTANGVVVSNQAPVAGDSLSGTWRQVTYTGTTSHLQQTGTIVPTIAPAGRLYQFTGRIQTTGVEAAVAAGNVSYVRVRIEWRDASSASLGYQLGIYDWNVDADGTFYADQVAPANAAKFVVQIEVGKASAGTPIVVRVGELTVRDLTAMGG